MSQKSARKSQNAALADDKEKADNPAKEMKKTAPHAEKDKPPQKTVKSHPTDKNDKPDKVTDKSQLEKDTKKVEKGAPTPDKAQKAEKTTPTPDKKSDKTAPTPDKKADKTDKTAPTPDKKADKSDKTAPSATPDKNAEKDKNDKGTDKKDKTVEANGKEKPEKPKSNGATNGEHTVSDDSEEDLLVIDDQDEVFPELAYDDTSDGEDDVPSRSYTRRSQVKSTKTPETPAPRPASVKEDESKEKTLKPVDPLATDRKLRSADSPKPESKKDSSKPAQDSPKKDATVDLTEDEKSVDTTGKNKLELEVVIELDSLEGEAKGKTRARVSPYTRAARLDQTTTSVTANYTGNNTTMEMDITETSISEEDPLDDSGYLRGLRTIRGRSSYKPLKELSLKHTLNRSTRSAASVNASLSESARPTGTVVGRKRKPDGDEVELAREVTEAGGEEDAEGGDEGLHTHTKRMRLFERFSVPFRGFGSRRAAEIVGINSDLPLSAPVASTSSFDPEALKTTSSSSAELIAAPIGTTTDRDGKRCTIM